MIEIKSIEQDMLNELFNSNIRPRIQLNKNDVYSVKFSDDELVKIKEIEKSYHTVVGIDIYQYSLFPIKKQIFIPHLFKLIYDATWEMIVENYEFIFQNYKWIKHPDDNLMKYEDYFIDTGDGGFQILESPLHGIIFILTFSTILRLYNSDLFMRKLYAKIGKIELRYSMTFDNLYRYNNNYYGTAIINNSRILGKDKLNRFLIDSNTYDWFLDRMIGIENLMSLGLNNIKEIEEFKNYDFDRIHTMQNALIPEEFNKINKEGIKSIDVQKIGKILQKKTYLDIYNVHIQAVIQYINLFKYEKIITISVGNLNISGIEGLE